MVLEKVWDDVAGGPSPDSGLGKLRNFSSKPLILKDDAAAGGSSSSSKYQRSMSMPAASPQTPGTPVSPSTPSSAGAAKPNVWRSVFQPGSNQNTKTLGAHQLFDNAQPNSPTVYDWLYSRATKSSHR